jgi:hypothetical protein
VEIKSVTKEFVDLRLTVDELMLLNNAISESLNAIEQWEYHTRVGATAAEAQALLHEIHDTIDQTRNV